VNRAKDVLVLGGGVIGCSIAYHLAKAGIEVLVVDQGEVGAQASSAAAGLLAPLLPFSSSPEFARLLLASFALFPALVPELEAASGSPVHFERTGALRTANNARGVARLERHLDSWRSWGFQPTMLTGDGARSIEPELSPGISGAVFAPEEAQVKAPALVNAFARAAANTGATLRDHTEVVSLQCRSGRVTGVLTAQGETLSCNHLVVAAGAWSAIGGAWLGLDVPVRPLRGQILLLRQPSSPVRHILFGEGIYLAPKVGGTVLVGATKDDVGFDTQITPEGVAWLREAAQRLVPALGGSELVAAWAGLRPKTPDGQPILGPVPGWGNVTIATGHNAFGLMLSAITGQLIAQQVTTADTPELLRPFSPLRFGGPAAKTFATTVA
jgi:glycine oxidase